MNFISLCSHKAVVSVKIRDAEMLMRGLNALAVEISKSPTAMAYESQVDLRYIKNAERKLTMILRVTETREQREERLRNKNKERKSE